jgi:hypothetical protein
LRPHRLIGLVTILLGCSKGASIGTRPDPAQATSDTCATLAASWRPPLTGPWKEALDSSETVTKPSDPTIRYIRTRFDVWFADSLSGPAACRLLERHHARVLAGVRDASGAGAYTIAVPDPGADWPAWEALVARLSEEPGFRHVYGIAYGGKFQTREPT